MSVTYEAYVGKWFDLEQPVYSGSLESVMLNIHEHVSYSGEVRWSIVKVTDHSINGEIDGCHRELFMDFTTNIE